MKCAHCAVRHATGKCPVTNQLFCGEKCQQAYYFELLAGRAKRPRPVEIQETGPDIVIPIAEDAIDPAEQQDFFTLGTLRFKLIPLFMQVINRQDRFIRTTMKYITDEKANDIFNAAVARYPMAVKTSFGRDFVSSDLLSVSKFAAHTYSVFYQSADTIECVSQLIRQNHVFHVAIARASRKLESLPLLHLLGRYENSDSMRQHGFKILEVSIVPNPTPDMIFDQFFNVFWRYFQNVNIRFPEDLKPYRDALLEDAIARPLPQVDEHFSLIRSELKKKLQPGRDNLVTYQFFIDTALGKKLDWVEIDIPIGTPIVEMHRFLNEYLDNFIPIPSSDEYEVQSIVVDTNRVRLYYDPIPEAPEFGNDQDDIANFKAELAAEPPLDGVYEHVIFDEATSIRVFQLYDFRLPVFLTPGDQPTHIVFGTHMTKLSLLNAGMCDACATDLNAGMGQVFAPKKKATTYDLSKVKAGVLLTDKDAIRRLIASEAYKPYLAFSHPRQNAGIGHHRIVVPLLEGLNWLENENTRKIALKKTAKARLDCEECR